MKTLIIAEKPSVGQEIARVLGAKQKSRAYIEGNDVIVTWALGHLLGLKMPEEYHKAWQTWRLEDLPLMPEKMDITPLKSTRKQLQTIRELANRKDIKDCVIATDAGREGELVARWILQYVHFKKPVKRLWISSQTDKAIREGFKQLKPAKEYDHLYQAALARAEADWLIGLNVTRGLTVKYQDQLSAGRVQTPTLAMVDRQDQKINQFVPQKYFEIYLSLGKETAKMIAPKQQFAKRDLAQVWVDAHKNQKVIVQKQTEKIHSEKAPLPYDLTALQREANQRYQFSAKKTLSLLQALYEQHKIVTYPRTDSRYLTDDMQQTMSERLQAVRSFAGDAVGAMLKNSGKVVQKRVFNNQKVTDHHGLIPTEQAPNVSRLSNDELRIYRLIVERFLMLFYPDYETKKMTNELVIGDGIFQYMTQTVLQSGWRAVSKESNGEANGLILSQGQTFSGNFQISEKLTQPPKPLTESSLLGEMEKTGLGTPATRAEIIEKLINTDLMERKQNNLQVTPKGKQLLKLVNPALVSPELTAKWEQDLEKIATGKLQPQTFMQQIRQETTKLVAEIKQSQHQYKDYQLTDKICPDCGSKLKEKNGRDGKLYICSNAECQYRRRKDPKVSNHRCPQCHKKMVILTGKNGQYFKCQTCGISEKLADKKQSTGKLNKHEEKKLLKKYQQKDTSEPDESPLALALKAAMEKQD